MMLTCDGLEVVSETPDEGRDIIARFRTKGCKWGQGGAGHGLYSEHWDRQMGEWQGAQFRFNPSILHYLDTSPDALLAAGKIYCPSPRRHSHPSPTKAST